MNFFFRLWIIKGTLLLGLSFIYSNTIAQEKIQTFRKLTRPEKFWIYFHPFFSGRAYKVTKEVLATTRLIKEKNNLGFWEEDAFRHSYWMARLTVEIGRNRAFALGNAHEKGNYLDFKKSRLEDGIIPDKPSSEMDFWNNKIGICIGIESSQKNPEILSELVLKAMKSGKLLTFKTNEKGDFLNCDGKIIPEEELTGKWENRKCLVPTK